MKLALFDIDGTLTRTLGYCNDLLSEAIATVAEVPGLTLDWSLDPDCTDSGLTAAHFHHAHGRAPSSDEMQAVHDRFLGGLQAADVSAEPVRGARDVLHRVEAHPQWAIGLATGNWRSTAEVKFRWAGLDWCDERPIGCADDAHRRPDILRAAVERARARHGVERFERVVYLGDGTHDVRAARAIGAGFVAVTAVRPPEPLRDEGARTFLDHFEDDDRLWQALDRAPVPELSE
ncbi:MAG: HAD family hydrolase [Planctomycetota bacterium]